MVKPITSHNRAPEQIEHAKDRYLTEAKRLLSVLDVQLAKTNAFVSGADYTIADMAIYPWVKTFLAKFKDKLDQNAYQHIRRWLTTIDERPQVQKGVKVCGYN